MTVVAGSGSVWLRALGLGPRGREFKSHLPDHPGLGDAIGPAPLWGASVLQ